MYKITWHGSTGTVEDEQGNFVKRIWGGWDKRDLGREYSLSEAKEFYLNLHPDAIGDSETFWDDIHEFWRKHHKPKNDVIEYSETIPLNSWEEE